MTLIYAFSNQWSTNVSCRTLLEIQKNLNNQNIIFQKIYFHPKSFFQKYILNKQYDAIIGLGDFYGNLSKIRLETKAKNLYGNRPISTNSSYLLPINIPPITNFDNSNFSVAENLGSYNCNWIAYQTQLYLNSRNLDTFHLFFHLPKKVPPILLCKQIIGFLHTNKVLK